MYACLTIKGKRWGAEKGSREGQGHSDGDVFGWGAHCPVGFAVGLCPALASPQCLFKTKQSSLKTKNHSYKFIVINSLFY